MGALSPAQCEAFRRDGYTLAPGAVTAGQLAALRAELAAWAADAQRRGENFGKTVDGRARFDLAPGPTPTLRRVNNPVEVSDAYRAVMAESAMTDMVAALIGPDVKFHHSKINLKLPGAATEVRFHQDFSYTPHTNADVVTALLLLDDMTLANGCLRVVPGSQRDGQISLWQEGRFTGVVPEDVETEARRRARPVTGPAGAACLMHTLALHGSDANRSPAPRSLFICVYSAADAFPLAPSPVPSRFEGQVVRGRESRVARLDVAEVELPERYTESSFFDVQARRSGD